MTSAGGIVAAPVRYYIDEHVRPAIVAYLRAHHIDVLTTQEAGRSAQGIDDADQLAFATAQRRVIVTSDNHFLNPRVVPQLLTGQHLGIVRLKDRADVGNQARYLRYIAETETMESMAGQFRYYELIPDGMFADDGSPQLADSEMASARLE